MEGCPPNISSNSPRPPFDDGLSLLLSFDLLNEKQGLLFLDAKVFGGILPGLDGISYEEICDQCLCSLGIMCLDDSNPSLLAILTKLGLSNCIMNSLSDCTIT